MIKSWIVSISLIVVVGIIFKIVDPQRLAKRKLRKAVVKPILEIKDGEEVKVSGTLVGLDEPILAPLSEKKCIAYEVIIEQNHGGSWEKIFGEKKVTRFLLSSNQEHVVIDALGEKQLAFQREVVFESGTFQNAPPKLEAYLNANAESSRGNFGLNKTLRYLEGTFEQDDFITVLGTAHWGLADEHGIDEPSKKVLVMSATKNGKLYIGDVV